MTKGIIHSTESFGSVDGPGVRFLIFLKGCDMRCKFCHNPDTWSMEGGTEAYADTILDKAERYKSYWGKDGGITVSGGDPLLQIDFVSELFEKAKKRGINTALDTSAHRFTREEPFFTKFAALMENTDTVLLDIKHIDDEEHKKLTGHTNANILDCAKYLNEINKDVWIRHVLVPTINDSEEYLQRLADFLKPLKNIKKIEILPYHTLGVYKWEQLGIKYGLEGIEPPTAESVEKAKKILGI